MAVGFQAFRRRTEESPQGKPDQLEGLSICGTEKTRIREKNHFPLFHSRRTDVFSREFDSAREKQERNACRNLWERRGLLSALLSVNALS